MNHLKKAGIGTGIHYPIPLHLQKAYSSLNYQAGDFPITERVSAEIVSLPMYPQLTAEQQTTIVQEIGNFIDLTPEVKQPTQTATFETVERTA
jgi:dTDP-4-amino-4,6-dideoxygalactose transaminase